jgi:di/tricarboxylate transporter
MTLEILFVLAIVILAVYLFATERFPIDLTALILMGILLLSGVVTAEDGISGFSNTATVTVGAMFILSAGLFKTGAVNFISRILEKLFKFNFWVAVAIMMITAGSLSAFINNTAVVAIFLPMILTIARQTNVSPSRALIPLSFASMFGGVCTLIGTSTNILVSSIAERHGHPAFSMFEFFSLGIIFFGGGVLYMLLFGIHLIPKRRTTSDLTENFGMGEYLTEIILLPEAKSVGKTLGNSPLAKDLDIEVLEITREGRRLLLPRPDTILQENDMLRVRCDIEKIKKLQERVGIRLKSQAIWHDKDLESSEVVLVEAVIAPNSIIEGKSLKEIRFRETFGATALAIRHAGHLIHEKLGTTELRAGDVLLIEVMRDHLEQLKEQKTFVLVSEVGFPSFRKKKLLPAVGIVAGVVAAAALGILPIVVSAIIGCILMVITGCISLEEAYKGIDWKVIFLLAGVLTLGVAMEKTGTALLLANVMTSTIGALGPVAVLSAFYLLATLLTNTMSNNATAALLAPIAISTAAFLGVNARPFLMAVTFAASSSFMTPVGYQTNTMIYGPGQYRFSDFLRVGTPLNILFWILATWFIPQYWPF